MSEMQRVVPLGRMYFTQGLAMDVGIGGRSFLVVFTAVFLPLARF